MMKRFSKQIASALSVLAVVFFAFGCAHTPETRIAKNPELFEQLTPEEQQSVRAGAIQLGYTPDMVFLALGEPDRKITRRTKDDNLNIWIYQGRFVSTETVRVRDQFGSFRPVHPTLYLDRTVEHVYTKARVVFEDGRVISIEQSDR